MRVHSGLTVALALVLTSCVPPESAHPLSAPESAKADKRLSGLFTSHLDGVLVTLELVPKTGALVDLVLTGTDKDKGASVLAFEAFPTMLAGKSYLNLRAKTFKGPYADGAEVAEKYIFAKYEFGKDGALTLAIMEEEPVKAAIDAKKLAGTAGERALQLTASSEELAAFVQGADAKVLFRKFAVFRKIASVVERR
ncbi:MAG: hypothetical protein JST92_17370 [Deltaproteobacteria bacterium]|nr:hypothetical protein [Deltaproteobacteria bacterium]